MITNKIQLDHSLKEDASIPNLIDKRVGSRIRLRRRLLGYSQEKLALALSLSFQQIQKYEKGTNRVGASRLFDIAQVLQVPINFFFDELLNPVYVEKGISSGPQTAVEDIGHAVEDQISSMEEEGSISDVFEVINSKETANLLKAYYSIKDDAVRQKLLHLIKVMGESR
ncbi:helix-turn-helix domain-containing protein [Commensalibacter oyaizuii]|uniref:Helix-turn-helix transcriptional regulator n=1 Tax=Commensalibacter oyaizuii TaxID=3043873 RepID=A0ABT6Q1S8_9PROT|nr:helix-turn-helix transcriptional regulator [Commensalibacter sp. TBRC 16381]MDI2091069.1 helix-turn-helix transcriptional regulator [Commensalibacter sp. TBRC 16381]